GPGTLLESVERSERWGRYSFVSGRPAATLVHDGQQLEAIEQVRDLPFDPRETAGLDPLSSLKAAAGGLRAPRLAQLPVLIGGFAGALTYEAAALFDGHPYPGHPSTAPITLQVVDRPVVFDHWRQR